MPTDAQKDKAIELYLKGVRCKEIGGLLGLTKNAVIGIIGRARKHGKLPPAAPRPVRRHKSKRPPVKVLETAAPTTGNDAVDKVLKRKWVKHKVFVPITPPTKNEEPGRWVPLLECSAFTCRWTDDGKTFCNAPVPKGNKSWCDEHYPYVYVVGSHFKPRIKFNA